MARSEIAWPVYFAAKSVSGSHLSIREGDRLPIQTKQFVRDLGPAFGVPNAADLPFDQLDYVRVVNVRSQVMAEQIRQQGLGHKQAAKLVTAEA